MARLKFFVFLVASIAIAFVGLVHLSGNSASQARVELTERLGWGQQLFETSGKLAQSLRTSALAVASADSALQQAAAGFKDAAPGEPAATAARSAVTTALAKLPEAIRGASAVLIGTERGVTVVPMAEGAAELKAKEAFSLAQAAEAGPLGTYALVDGRLYRVAAAPIRILGTAGEQTVGLLGAAFPLDDAFAVQRAKELTLDVTVAAGDLVLSSLSGEQRAAAAKASDGPLAGGTFASLGPISLPLFAGLTASRYEARSFALPGIENARVVLTAESYGLVALADFQKKALLGICALLLLGIAIALLLGSGAAVAATQPLVAPAAEEAAQPVQAAQSPDQPLEVAQGGDSLFGNAPPPAPAVTPDDFPFGDSAPAPAQPVAAEPAVTAAPEPAVMAAPEPFAAPPAPEPQQYVEPANDAIPMPAPAGFSPFDAAPAPAAEPPFDPFAAAAADSSYPPDNNDSHEATVVAAVPQELLRAATRARPAAPIITPQAMPAVALPAPPMDPEEAHFQDVFNQFVATRAQCNEPADGLTLEKFTVKLRKNKEQLVQKYNCKSVRFQVYVKEGKAALKATPVKD